MHKVYCICSCFYNSMLTTAVARGVMFSGCLFHFCEGYISRIPWGTFLKFDTNAGNLGWPD